MCISSELESWWILLYFIGARLDSKCVKNMPTSNWINGRKTATQTTFLVSIFMTGSWPHWNELMRVLSRILPLISTFPNAKSTNKNARSFLAVPLRPFHISSQIILFRILYSLKIACVCTKLKLKLSLKMEHSSAIL